MRRTTLPSTIALLIACVLSLTKADESLVTCGSAIKIQQKDTGYYLNSEDKQLAGGSGQQIVTFVKDEATHNTLWMLRPADHSFDRPEMEYPENASCQLAKPIPCGTTIRLSHAGTNRNLHSHGVKSVLSRQQEVTGYGTGDGLGDGGDNWVVQCNTRYWKRGTAFHLKHVDTGKFLGTSSNTEFNESTCGRGCPIMRHLEAFGRGANDAHTILKVEQGIHLSF